MRSQEIKRVKEGKANKKERSAESIISSVLGIMRVKCDISRSRYLKRPIDPDFKKKK